MQDLGLKSYDKLYPMMIRKYSDLIVDQNASETDKINQIITQLNALGKLSNDVVRNWNTVYQWTMNDGLTTDVSNKVEEMKANGELDTVLQSVFASLAGDLSTLHTAAKDNLVNSINEVDDLTKTNQTNVGTLASLTTTHKDNLVNAINDNAASLAERATINDDAWIDVTDKRFGAVPNNASIDNTPFFNAAISYAVANNIHKIKVPPGVFPVNLNITNSSITFEGAGETLWNASSGEMARSTILVPYDPTKPVLSLGTGTSAVSFQNIKDLSIIGRLTGYPSSQSYGILVKGIQYSVFSNVSVFTCGLDNIHITSGTNAPTQLVKFYNVTSQYSKGSCFYAEWGQSWTTSLYLYGYESMSDSGFPTTASSMVLDSTGVSMHNCYIDCTNFANTGIILRANFTNGGSTVYPSIAGADVTIDVLIAPQPAINVTYPTTRYDMSFLNVVDFSFNQGYILYQDGTQYKPRSDKFLRAGLGDFQEGLDVSGQYNMYPYNVRGSKSTATYTESLGATGGGYGASSYTNKITSLPNLAGVEYQFENTLKHYLAMPLSRNIPLGATAYGNGNHYLFWITSTGALRYKKVDNVIANYQYPASDTEGNFVGNVSDNGTTSNRSTSPVVAQHYFDTTLGKPIWCKTVGVIEVDTLTVSVGATATGNITITLNGVAKTVAVTAGQTAGQVGDTIRATTFTGWTVGGTVGSATVTFTKTAPGTNTAPSFSDTGTTGTSGSFAVTTTGTNNVWVDSTGTTV